MQCQRIHTCPPHDTSRNEHRTHLDLFSGIGGFTLAAQSAGFETIGFAETNEYAAKVLKERWPEITNYGDVRNVRNIPADLITGGFPCQPYSVAGKRRGNADDRALWPEMLRIIQESRPTWVLAENVAGIIKMALDNVLADLEAEGYACWPLVIPACAVDARHRRDRVWIVAHTASPRLSRHQPQAAVPRCESAPHAISCDPMFDSWDALAGCVRGLRSDDGLSVAMVQNEVRCYGNAIVPQVAETIIKAIVQAETCLFAGLHRTRVEHNYDQDQNAENKH